MLRHGEICNRIAARKNRRFKNLCFGRGVIVTTGASNFESAAE